MRYEFAFLPGSPYAHLVDLVEANLTQRGLVVDLGCGHAAIAAPLAAMGFEYAGCDGDEQTVAHLRSVGVDAHLLDLTANANLEQRLDEIAGDRQVVAVTALDVLEHLPRPDTVLVTLHRWMLRRSAEVLGVSIPNVAHVDIASKLLTGRWDVTPTGLLDETHLRFFTDRSLNDLMGQVGFAELARNDLRLIFSDQAWPPDHPTQSPDSMLGRYLRTIREMSDEHAEVNQFVRLFRLGEPATTCPEGGPTMAVVPRVDRRVPFLSVITRTTCERETLVDTLTCLAAQSDDDFEVLLMINSDDGSARRRVRDLVAGFDVTFQHRVRCIDVAGRHRVVPLNRGLEEAVGRYITVLDDDDLVFGDWVANFRAAAETHLGSVIRCRAVDQQVEAFGPTVAAVATDGFVAPYRASFDLASHLAGGQTPQGSVCFPAEAIETLEFRFDEGMDVCEDLHFLVRVASVCGVTDVPTFGLVYRRWARQHASLHTVAPEVWERAIQRIVEHLDAQPLLMPRGTASRLYQAAVQERQIFLLDQGSEALLRRAETGERIWSSLAHQFTELELHYRQLEADRDEWRRRAELQSSPGLARQLVRRVRARFPK